MAEGFYEYLQRERPELMEKLRFQAEVGEFPPSRIVLKEEQLPVEEFDSFSDDPLEFEECTAALAEDVHEIYMYSRILNRFSEKYQTISLQLEKGLAKLAGCCVTKAILEKKGFSFPMLENLAVMPLYCAASFNFRKVHAAIRETKNKNYKMWGQLVDIEFGWHALAERLKATEEKIQRIRSGKINVDALIDRIRLFRENKAPAAASRPRQAIPAGKAYAYPVSGAVIREMTAVPKGAVPGGTAEYRRGLSPLAQKEGKESRKKGEVAVPLRGGAKVVFAGSSEQFPVPQQYDSIKQRKKAERLARKHAREMTAGPKGIGKSTQYSVLGTQQKLLEGKGESIDMFEFLKARSERGFREVPVLVGELLPERA